MLSPTSALLVAAVSLASSVGFTWVVRGVMRRAGIMDVPSPEGGRKTHREPVAYEGGVAMYLAFLAGLVTATFLEPALFFDSERTRGLLIGATLIVAVGVADDLLDLRPVAKLIAQLGVGALMHWYGFEVEKISNPFGETIQLWGWASLLGTMLWYALLMNGLNMIDGMDGLAAGIAGISALTLCAIAVDLGQDVSLALALVLAAVCFGFLKFNFTPATIFMGDAGSLLLGFLLASITLLSSTKAPALLALLIPMVAVALPLFETVFAFVRRTLKGQHPFRGDRRHLHHRFLALGFSPRRTVLTFYYLTAYFGVVAYVLQRLEAKATLALVVIIGMGMLLLVENMRFLERTRR